MVELLILSTLTGLTTMTGVVLTVMFGQPGQRILAFYLGLSSGMMILIVLMDLLPAAFAEGPMEAVGMGLGIGMLTMLILHQVLHYLVGEHAVSMTPKKQEYYRMGTLIALAIAFHNIPEGIAIGTGFETHHDVGTMMALSIALHNVPEGIGMAGPLLLAGVKKRWILFSSLMISLCIPAGAWIGQLFSIGSPFMMALGLAFAAGAMGLIVWKEIGPTALKNSPLFAQLGMAASVGLMYIMHWLR